MSTVQTCNGLVAGVEHDGLQIFKGIPFAAPPIGRDRWAPPRPAENWQGTFDATEFGRQALQSSTPMAAMFGGVQEEIAFGEDCLTLNIWTAGCDDAARPVMVWIHGGAFILGSGSSPMYDGASLARRGVVLVSINYRMGAAGFLRLADLTQGGIPSSGNEGLLDQVAALEWVRDNIAGFGGDPGNVTIFGESAGGMSVGCLLGMDAATSLFHKAIPQSGACHTASPTEQANHVAQMTLEHLGIAADDVDALYAVSEADLLAAQENVLAELGIMGSERVRGMPYQPVVDGEQIAQLPIESIRSGSAAGKALLVGSTLEEMKLFDPMIPGPTNAEELKERLGGALSDAEAQRLIEGYESALRSRGAPAETADIGSAIMTDGVFRIPAVLLADAQLQHDSRVFMYLFDWHTEFFNLGACHALELAYVFGTHHMPRLEPFFDGAKPGADALAGAIMGAWTRFAATGSPGGEDIPSYARNRATLMLGAEIRVEEDPYATERALWHGLEDRIGHP